MLRQAVIKHVNLTVDKDDKQVIKELEQWIDDVSKKNPLIGGFSICPFASKFTYKIVFSPINDIEPLKDEFGVVIFVVEDDLDPEFVRIRCKELSETYSKYSFFDDCRDEPSFINGIQTNNGKYNLVLYQNRQLLRKMRENLAKTDYYSYWDSNYLRHILGEDSDLIK